MSLRRGTSILDLLPMTSDIAGAVPDRVVDQLGVLTVLDHRSVQNELVFFHHGSLQAPMDALGIDTSDWLIQVPGVTTGLPFRLAIRRGEPPAASNQQEQPPTGWVLDLLVQDVEVRIPGLR